MLAEPIRGRDADTIARLRRELLALRRERAALRARFLPPGRLPAVLSLPPQESVVVSVLLANSEVTHELMWQALYHDADPDAPPADKTVDVLICKARKRLTPFEIEIETFHRRGWRMAPNSKARMQKLIEAESFKSGRPLNNYVSVDLALHPYRPPGFK